MPPKDSQKPSEVARLVALGASNLTLGFSSLLDTARVVFGPEVEVLAALGYGRSYGAPSTIAIRTLPGILECGLWRELETRTQGPTQGPTQGKTQGKTRGLITDVGNDILYGVPPRQILAWVKEAAERLRGHMDDVVLTDIPRASIRRLSPATFLFFRTIFFPPCRLTRDDVFERVDEVNAGLADLARLMGLRFVQLKPDWYSLDPIHIRPKAWPTAWQEIVGDSSGIERPERSSPLELARLHLLPPERRFLMGVEQKAPQSGRKLRRGGRLWIY